jgi:TolB protein
MMLTATVARRFLPFAVFVGALAVGTSAAAHTHLAGGAQRHANGRISFGRFDPSLGDTSLWTARADGSHQRRLTRVVSFFSDWAPSGRRIAFDFVDTTGEHIATISPTGRDMRQISFGAGFQEVPKWSPTGRLIVFDASPVLPDAPGFHTSIWVMRADGSHIRQVTHRGFDVEPVFSPDGTRIAFGRITGTNTDGDQLEALYVVGVDGRHLHRVVAATAGLEHPDWSPNGRWISFNIAPEAAGARGAGSILAVHPDGNGLHALRRWTQRFKFYKAVWSPDGRKLLSGCFDVPAGTENLCVIRPDAGTISVVVDGSRSPVNYPAWGPRSDRHDAS